MCKSLCIYIQHGVTVHIHVYVCVKLWNVSLFFLTFYPFFICSIALKLILHSPFISFCLSSFLLSISLPLFPHPFSLSLSQATESSLPYPGWALAMLTMLILAASLPVPLGYLMSITRGGRGPPDEGSSPDVHRDRYTKCESSEPESVQSNGHVNELEEMARAAFLPLGHDHYRLLPQQEDGEEEEDTVV